MAILRAAKRAFGAPGIAPRWTQSAKDAIGTAYSAGSTVKLLRSTHDGQVFDRIPAVAERYQGRRRQQPIEIWTFNRRVRWVRSGTTLRVQAAAPFRLRWTADEWAVVEDTASPPTALGIEFVDVPIARLQAAPIRFTFFWPAAERWEGRDFAITVERNPG